MIGRLRAASLICVAILSVAAGALADVRMTDRAIILRHQQKLAIKEAQQARGHRSPSSARHTLSALGTGSLSLTDAGGVQYLINDDITFSTTSSASGAMKDAAYTHAVAATTSLGGTTASTLDDAFDGYNSLCLSLTGATGKCATGDPNYTIYNNKGPATLEGNGRQYDFSPQTIGNFTVSRKVFVPNNDQFARWLNIVTNTSGSPQQATVITANNLGSDANTIIVTTSSGDNVADVTDTWVTTFQNYSGGKSSDPRLGHVLQGPGAPVPLNHIDFTNGDDNPFWSYLFTLQPGQTGIIMNFVVVQPSKAAAAAKSAQLVGLPANALQFMSAQEQSEVLNFATAGPATHFVVSAPASATAGTPFNFTVTAEDASNHTATTYSGTVHFTSTDPAAALPGDSTLTNGVGTFSATLDTAGNRTITATDTVTMTITGTSNVILVSPAPATHFHIAAPASATSGVPFNITVTALDAFNNTATGYSGTVHFTSTDGMAMLPADSTLTNGVGTFSVTLKTTGNQSVTATDTVNDSITGSATIAVSQGVTAVVPTLGGTGMAILFGLLALAGLWAIRPERML